MFAVSAHDGLTPFQYQPRSLCRIPPFGSVYLHPREMPLIDFSVDHRAESQTAAGLLAGQPIADHRGHVDSIFDRWVRNVPIAVGRNDRMAGGRPRIETDLEVSAFPFVPRACPIPCRLVFDPGRGDRIRADSGVASTARVPDEKADRRPSEYSTFYRGPIGHFESQKHRIANVGPP